ncbi:MAG: MerR family transcriptional regulator [Commensalibacter sp.]
MSDIKSSNASNQLESQDDSIMDDNLDDFIGSEDGAVKKAPNAFRTISEVADEIHVPQHVLRFWETRFPQVQPVKRSGGRRYYRSEDIAILKHISNLLYVEGYTIRGVQRLLEEDASRFEEPKPAKTSVAADEQSVAQESESSESVAKLDDNNVLDIDDNCSELERLQKKTVFLTESLQTILSELQELRKLLVSS